MPPLEEPLARIHRLLLVAVPLTLLFGLVPSASAQDARLQSLGGVGLLVEDASNVFTNPSLAGVYNNRVFFSLGIDGADGRFQFDPHGGGFVTIKDMVTLGVVLNRNPQSYGFGEALWPVAEAYIPGGPGGVLEGPDGPAEETAPLRFPADVFLAIGNPWSKLRVGLNVYYGGGVERVWALDDSDQDDLEESLVGKRQTHLFSTTIGLSGGSLADRTRGEVWARISVLSAWYDERGFVEVTSGEAPEPTVDRVVALDKDLRFGGGVRLHLGDVEQGFVVTPAIEYDHALGVFRFDDNLVAPDSDAEKAQRNVTSNYGRLGLGVAWRGDGLLVHGAASIVIRNLQVINTLSVDEGIEQDTTNTVELGMPELAIGAEYRVLPPLLVRAGIRSVVVGGRTIGSERSAVGEASDPFETGVTQTVGMSPVTTNFAATGGIGLEVKRFRLDAIVGGLFLGGGSTMSGTDMSFFSRIDLGFDFN